MLNPSSRQNNRQWPTPRVQDTLFYDLVDVRRICPPGTDPPAYGTAHPKTGLYPNHTLCFIENASDDGLMQHWWYCASRASQEDYNADITYPYGGSLQYPRLTRTYILPRAEAETPVVLGTADPGGAFASSVQVMRADGTEIFRTDGVTTILRTASSTPTLVAQSKREIGGQIGSLYCEVTRIFEVIPGSDDATPGSGAGQVDNGYKVTRPIQDKDFLLLTWALVLPRVTGDLYRATPGDVCPITNYGNLTLVTEAIEASDDDNQKSTITRIYQGNISGAAYPSAPVVTNVREHPGIFPPEKYLEVTITHTDTTGINNPANPDLVPPTLPSGYVLMAIEVKPDGTVTGNRSVVSKYYSAIKVLVGSQWDDNLRDYVSYTTTVMTPANAALAVSGAAAGTEVTVTPYSAYWSIVTVEAPTESSASGASKTYLTTMPFSWPQVLTAFYGGFIGRKYPRGGEVVDGYSEFWYDYKMKRAWTGICKAQVTVAWSKLPPLFSAIQAMDPQAIFVNWPTVKISIPPCLHGLLLDGTESLTATTGTENPDYGYVAFTRDFPETNYTDWPDSIVADDDIKPYKGGFLRRTVTVYKPY